MTKPPVPLTSLSEEQREQAQSQFAIIRPVLEDGITQAQLACTHRIPASTIQRWVKRYREQGLSGLADAKARSDKGKSRRLLTKEDPRWQICGIPSVFYTDHGSDFPSKHMEQVAIDLGIELIFSEKGVPRGRGKIERFFRNVNELLLQDLPGYAPSGHRGGQATLTLAAFEEKFLAWMLSDYHSRVHGETKWTPAERWKSGGFLPRMHQSLEQLDLLLLTVRKTRRVQQDSICFEGYRYIDPTLAGFVKEDVPISRRFLNRRQSKSGKTGSAKRYAYWSLFKPFLPESLITFTGLSAMDGLYPYRPFTFASPPLEASVQQCRTEFYTPPVSASVARKMQPLSEEEMRDFLSKRWSHRVKAYVNDFTDLERDTLDELSQKPLVSCDNPCVALILCSSTGSRGCDIGEDYD